MVCVQLEHFDVCSCYFSPHKSVEDFEAFLNDTQELLCKNKKKTLIGGDFNTKSVAFGSTHTDRRGELLEELIEAGDLVICNEGTTPTFANAKGTSIIDLTLCHPGFNKWVCNWRVDIDHVNFSNHRTIRFELTVPVNTNSTTMTFGGWRVDCDTHENFLRGAQNEDIGSDA